MPDTFAFFGRAAVIVVYGATLVLSFWLAFFIRYYLKLEEGFARYDVIRQNPQSPMRRNIFFINDWCVANHTAIGFVLMGLSMWVLGTMFVAIGNL